MKKIALLALVPALVGLSGCGTTPSQVTGGNRVSVGVAAGDAGSSETATKTVVAATETSPAQVQWTISAGTGVTFTFMTAPGSDAAYITGYRIVKRVLTTNAGTTTSTDVVSVNKSNLYLTSGYVCTSRSALRSCSNADTDAVPANGVPGQLNIYLEGGLGSLAQSTNSGVSVVTDIEFVGKSSNGQPIVVTVDGVVSQGIRAGVE